MRKYLHLMAVLFVSCGYSFAAEIIWTSSAFVNEGRGGRTKELTGTGNFATTGTFIGAVNAGGDALTFDGIEFTTSDANIDLSELGNFYSSYHSSVVGQLSASGSWDETPNSAKTITLTGLDFGQGYRVGHLRGITG